jgi:predicted kinase
MECVILIGIQGSGKSTFYKEYFFHSHVRINLDMLKTRHKEDIYLAASYQAKQKFVVDNTNARLQDRSKYIQLSKKFGYKVIVYYLKPDIAGSLHRNEGRHGKARVPAAAIRATLNKLEAPDFTEGFDELYEVVIENEQFMISNIDRQVF